MDGREREPDRGDVAIDRARSLFAETARRSDLRLEWDDTAPVEVACRLPAQRGLDFDLRLSLCDGEFVCSGERWYATVFPADDEREWDLMVRLVEGLVTGEARIVLYRAFGWTKPYWTQVQLRRDGRWTSVSTGIGCAVPPIVRSTIVRNGHATTRGGWRPAAGSIVALLLLVVGVACWWR